MNRIHDDTIDPVRISQHPHQKCHLIQTFPELIEQLSLLAANTKRRNRKKLRRPQYLFLKTLI